MLKKSHFGGFFLLTTLVFLSYTRSQYLKQKILETERNYPMLSFNNKNIQELSKKELSIQIYNLSNFYKSYNVELKYITMTLSIAELLEHDLSDFNFSLKTFKYFVKNPNFSHYEKSLIMEGYKKHLTETQARLKKINVNDINVIYYQGVIELIESEKIVLEYKQTSNTNNEKATVICLEKIENKIESLEVLKNKQSIKAVQNILDLSLKELYFCQNISNYIT
jgi:hypothetical protein